MGFDIDGAGIVWLNLPVMKTLRLAFNIARLGLAFTAIVLCIAGVQSCPPLFFLALPCLFAFLAILAGV